MSWEVLLLGAIKYYYRDDPRDNIRRERLKQGKARDAARNFDKEGWVPGGTVEKGHFELGKQWRGKSRRDGEFQGCMAGVHQWRQSNAIGRVAALDAGRFGGEVYGIGNRQRQQAIMGGDFGSLILAVAKHASRDTKEELEKVEQLKTEKARDAAYNSHKKGWVPGGHLEKGHFKPVSKEMREHIKDVLGVDC